MTNEEKILRFAGHTGTPTLHPTELEWRDPNGVLLPTLGIYDPDGGTLSLPQFPDTTDLTWLFKWCVPVAIERFGIDEVHMMLINWAYTAMLTGKAPTGEALRAAIVALIGEGDGC